MVQTSPNCKSHITVADIRRVLTHITETDNNACTAPLKPTNCTNRRTSPQPTSGAHRITESDNRRTVARSSELSEDEPAPVCASIILFGSLAPELALHPSRAPIIHRRAVINYETECFTTSLVWQHIVYPRALLPDEVICVSFCLYRGRGQGEETGEGFDGNLLPGGC